MKIKCFETVSDAIKDISMCYPELGIDREKYEILEEYCDSIDVLATEFKANALTAGINTNDFSITIKIECEDIIIEFGSRRYNDLCERAISFGYYTLGEDILINEFTFPSVWIKG